MAATPRDIQRLVGVHPHLASIIINILRTLPMFVAQGVRTAEYQHSLYLIGRTGGKGKIVTDKDGYVHKSDHQPHADGLGYAVDCAWIGSDPFALSHDWPSYGAAGEAQGLIWGGRWKSPVDLDHLELPEGVAK